MIHPHLSVWLGIPCPGRYLQYRSLNKHIKALFFVLNRHKLATAPIYCKLVRFILQQTLRLCSHGNPLDVKLVVNCVENVVVCGNLLQEGGMGCSLRGWLGSMSFVS